jgi:hypothetical protein
VLTSKRKPDATTNLNYHFRVTTFQLFPHPDPGGPAGLSTHSQAFTNKAAAFVYAAKQTLPFLILSPDAPPIGSLPLGYHLDLARELAKPTWTTSQVSPYAYVGRGLMDIDSPEGRAQITEALILMGHNEPPEDSGIHAQGSGQAEPAYVPPKRKREGIEDEPALPSVTSRRTRRDKGKRRGLRANVELS